MDFKELTQPSIFLASPGDLGGLRTGILNAFKMLRTQVSNDRNVEAYAWESEVRELGFQQWLPAAQQIPVPSDPLCEAVLCYFAERIGTPMLKPEKYRDRLGNAEHTGCDAGHLVLDWTDGAEKEGGFPLTGTVFEVLVALASNEKAGSSSVGRPPMHIWFVGDESILHADPEEANWGNKQHYNEVTKSNPRHVRKLLDDYFSQTRQLRNFIEYLKYRNVPLTEHAIVHDFEEAIQQSRKFLVKHLKYTTNQRKVDPFKGLQFYDVEDEGVFFGRKPLIESALAEFERQWSAPQLPFLGIVGGSGAGKSSLLRAGLVSRLQERYGTRRTRCAVVTARDLTAPPLEGSHLPSPIREPFHKFLDLVARALGSKLDLRTSLDPDQALTFILSLLNPATKDGVQSVDERLVIGLDQFEEVLDYRAAVASSGELTPLFRFMTKACQSGCIGFIYTCQTNRVELLSQDLDLSTLVERGSQKWVSSIDEEAIRDVAVRKFEIVNVELSRGVLDLLRSHVDAFMTKATQIEIGVEKPRDSQASLLPLLSLVLLRLSRYCEQKRSELEAVQIAQSGRRLRAEKSSLLSSYKVAANSYPSNQTCLTTDGTLFVALGDLPEAILRIERAISDQAEKVLKDIHEVPGVSWDDDALAALFRRLVRIESTREDRLSLTALPIPRRRGVTSTFVEKMQEHRLLIPVGRGQIRLVHQAVVESWPPAAKWLEQEKELLRAANQLHSMAAYWRASDRISQHLAVSPFQTDLIGRLLSNWRDVFRPKDGTVAQEEDRLLAEFAFAVLAAQNTPGRKVEDAKLTTSHFLIAVEYGASSLVAQYLRSEPPQAREAQNSKGSNAAYAASSADDLETLDLVLLAGADATMANHDGWGPIHFAASNGNVRMLDRMIEAGADACTPGSGARTCLHLAAANNDLVMTRHLIETCVADPNVRSSNGWTPLHDACAAGASNVARYLLSLDEVQSNQPDNDGWSPFLLACRYADGETVRDLLRRPSTQVLETFNGWSALHLAIHRRSAGTVDALLQDQRIARASETPTKKTTIELAVDEWGIEGVAALLRDPYRKVDPDTSCSGRESPLSLACKARSADLVQVLVQGGADVNRGKLSPFLETAERGDAPILELLFAKADLTKADNAGRTALHLAALNGHVEAIRTIVVKTDRNLHVRRDDNGRTALHLAASEGQFNAVEALLPHIDPRLKDHQGDTPLHLAAALGYLPVARALITRDRTLLEVRDALGRMYAHVAAMAGNKDMLHSSIDPQCRLRNDGQGMLPLHYAALFGKAEVMDMLLEGNDPDVVDNFGWTALHMAARSGAADAVVKLLSAHASPLLASGSPLTTPFHVAAAAGHPKILELLSSTFSETEIEEEFWEAALLASINNAQFETAETVLNLRERGR